MKPRNPTPRQTSRAGFARTCLLLVLPSLASIAFAQSTAAAKSEGEVVTLTPFTVSTERDYGYRAANSISATRTNTPIKDVPVNIQVFGEELYEDLSVNSQVDLERYNASLINGGSDSYSDNAIQQAYNAFLFRGFTQNWGLRDGTREYDPVDTQGLARVEVVKGPVAALYGVSYPGGVLNSVNKSVDYSHNFTKVRVTARSEGGYRATLDSNFSGDIAGGKGGIRFNAANEKTEDERDHSEGKINFYQLGADWKPTKLTTISLLLEHSYRGKPNGLNSYAFQRGDSANPDSQASIPLQIIHPEIPWTWNWSNGSNLRSLEVKYYRAAITQQVGDNFSFNAYVQNNSHDQIDGNGWDQAGSSGADSWEVAGRGWYTENGIDKIESGYSYRDWTNVVHTYGATGVYKLDFAPVKNTFTFGGAAWAENFLSHKSNSTAVISHPFAVGSSIVVPYGPPTDLHPDLVGGYGHQNNTNDYYFAALMSSFFDDRLKTNFAVNRTHVKNVAWASGVDNAPVSYDITKTSPMIGGVYSITKSINLFAVHSTSLFPTSVTNSFGAPLPAVTGSSIEGGVKFETVDGKLSGTVSYYEIKQTGGFQTDPTAVSQATNTYDQLTAQNTPTSIAQRDSLYPGGRPLGDSVSGGESKSKGAEVDLNYQPTHNWAIQFSYAHNTNRVVTAINSATIGQANPGTIKQQFSILTKYTFTDGAVKGLSIGAGLASADKALQGYVMDAATSKLLARYNPSTVYLDAFVTYRFKAFGRKQAIQFNGKNLTEQGEFTGWKPTGSKALATQRYEVPVSRRFELTYAIEL